MDIEAIKEFIESMMKHGLINIKPDTFNIHIEFVEYAKSASRDDKKLTFIFPEG